MKWQPIDTAPKDGTEVLVYCPCKYGMNYHVARYEEKPDLWFGSTGEGCEGWLPSSPTNWMELPSPPALMEWQPIDTIPRDSSTVRLLNRKGMEDFGEWYNAEGFPLQQQLNTREGLGDYTHWMLMPAPPTT